MKTVSLSFYRFKSPLNRLWALGMMGAGRIALAKTPGVELWKLFGSGTGNGFSPTLNPSVFAILAVWPDQETARTGTRDAAIFNRYQARAEDAWTVFLGTTSVRGAWDGTDPFKVVMEAQSGPVAFLTRATIKPSAGLRFWKKVPNISDAISTDDNVTFKAGIGELPFLQQVTFSIWPNAQTMSQFAYKDGPHAKAIKAVRDGDWFSEELFARFAVLGDSGTWNGTSPISHLTERHA